MVHAALRQVLGPNAVQAGSLNRPGYLRFDFNWQGALTDDQRTQIEEVTNEAVEADFEVHTFTTELEKAKAMGAMALFGEQYPEEVRVVEIGGPFSLELCGGTHVHNSAQIGPVTILGESSVGSGVRRVEAYVGLDSFRHLAKERALMAGLASSLKVPSDEVPARVANLVERLQAPPRRSSTGSGWPTPGPPPPTPPPAPSRSVRSDSWRSGWRAGRRARTCVGWSATSAASSAATRPWSR